MKRTLVVTGAVLLAALLVGVTALKVLKLAQPDETVIVGAVLPLSGPAASMGEGTLNGLRLAEEHANTGRWGELPFRVKIIAEDGAAIPKTSIGAYRKLTDVEKARIVVTMGSGVCMALKPLAEQEGVLLFANATHPGITEASTLTIRHSQTASQEAKTISDAILQRRPATGVAILYQNDDYGVAFAKEVQMDMGRASVKLLSEQAYAPSGMDARILAQKAMEGTPDAVVVLGVGKDLGLVIRRLREYGFAGDIYTGLGFVVISGAAEAAGEYARGVRHTQFDFDLDSAIYRQLAEEYMGRFRQELSATGLIAYNTVKILCAAAQDGQLTPQVLAKRIREMKEYQGVGERILISISGDLTPAIRLASFVK